MTKYIQNEIRTNKNVLSIDGDLSIQINELGENHREGIFKNNYSIRLSSTDKPFEYNVADNKIYFYTLNEDMAKQQEDEHSALIEGKSEEQQLELIAGKYREYIDQHEYVIIHNGENITNKILELIK